MDSSLQQWSLPWYVSSTRSQTELASTVYFFPVTGGWSPWSPGKCSRHCGLGTQVNYRQCDRPEPVGGGAKCDGESTFMSDCMVRGCKGMIRFFPRWIITSRLSFLDSRNAGSSITMDPGSLLVIMTAILFVLQTNQVG